MKMKTVTIGGDCAKLTGISVWVDGKLVRQSLVAAEPYDSSVRLKELRSCLKDAGVKERAPRLAEVYWSPEEAHIGKNPRSSMSVVKQISGWSVVANALGIKLMKPVLPATWRASFKIHSSRGNCKSQAVSLVSKEFGLPHDVDENIAEAVLIGLHSHVLTLGAKTPPHLSWVRENQIGVAERRAKRR